MRSDGTIPAARCAASRGVLARTHAAFRKALDSRKSPAAWRSPDTPNGRLLSQGSRKSIAHGTGAAVAAMSPAACRE